MKKSDHRPGHPSARRPKLRSRQLGATRSQSLGQILRDLFRCMGETDMQFLAGSLAFGTVISLVPLLAVSLSVFVFFGGLENLLKKVEPFILQNLVEGSGVQLSHYIRSAVERIQGGALGAVGVVGLLVVSTKLFYDIETAIQRIWMVDSKRSIIQRWLVYWIAIFGGPLCLAVLLGAVGSKDFVLGHSPKSVIAFCFSVGFLFLVYKLVPACKVSFRSAFWGALSASLAILVAQETYVIIAAKILHYNKVYGSLASVPIFLIWVLTLWWIFLIGVALTAVLERRG